MEAAESIKNPIGKLLIFSTILVLTACGSVADFEPGGGSENPTGETGETERSFSTFGNRSIDGTGNNLQNPSWGAVNTQIVRLVAPAYADGISAPAGNDRPNPREISNQLSFQDESRSNDRNLSSFVYMWGQFVDHDIDLTPENQSEYLPILVPSGDVYFDPEATGLVEIPFFRSSFDSDTGTDSANPRQQVNVITAWIDASQVYGSDEERATWLRSGQDGKLKASTGNFLPFNDGSIDNAPDNSTDLFVAGDVRANEQAALTAMHTLFMREHNRLCDQIRAQQPEWSDEQIYQRARKWVGAHMQAITFEEFLPAFLGSRNIRPYSGYDEQLDPSIINEFSTAFFRVGHTMLTEELWRLDEDGDTIPEGHLSLADAFFDTTTILLGGGIDPLLRGLAAQPVEEVDTLLVDAIRSFLFGIPGAGGLDLASLNLQRGRDHGLPDYNTVRRALGLAAARDFGDITSDHNLAKKLEDVYGSVEKVDLWMGVLAEDHVRNSSVGETLLRGLILQFENLRAADHYWYELDPAFSFEDVRIIKATRLSDIIRRNTAIQNIPDDVFRIPE